MKKSIQPDEPDQSPDRPNNLAIMIRFAVIAAAALALLAFARYR